MRGSPAPVAGGGARCTTASARPARRASDAGRSRSPRSGSAPAARSSATRAALDVSASTRQRPASRRTTRRPTSPQPTISSTGLLKRVGRSVTAAGIAPARRGRSGQRGGKRAKSRAESRRRDSAPRLTIPDAFHRHRPAQRQELQRRARRTDPASGDPPGHRPALRLPRRRLRIVQVPHARGPRDPRRAPAEGAQPRGRSGRPHPHLPGCAADRHRPGSAHGAGRRRVRDQEAAEPRRLDRQARARRRHRAPAAARQRPVPVPRRPVHRVHPARRRAAQLLDGQRAAHRHRPAAARAAHPPPARRQVHRPRLQRDEGKGDPARRRSVRQLLPARFRQADHPARVGQRASRRSRRSSST